MRITAISAYVPTQRHARQTPPQRDMVTVQLPTPQRIDASTMFALSGRGMIVDVLC